MSPHAPIAVPGSHVLAAPAMNSQQPPLHPEYVSVPSRHVVEHVPVVMSHASPDGQSVAVVQGPHVPAAVHVGVAPEQPVHVPPPAPHSLAAVPATHDPPVGWQHPPLHALYVPAIPQLFEQTGPPAAVRSHDSSDGQSPGPVQPHAPFTHAAPDPPERQLAQLVPHAPGLVSATHAKPTQHEPAPHCPLPA